MAKGDKVHKCSKTFFNRKFKHTSLADNPCHYDAYVVSWDWKKVTCKACLRKMPAEKDSHDG